MGDCGWSLIPKRAPLLAALVLGACCWAVLFAQVPVASAGSVAPNAFGGLDCNGYSPVQKPIRVSLACRDLANPTYPDDRFWDGSHYIGHDEPDLNFSSPNPGSGNDVTWTFTLGVDPASPATVTSPGHDISHYVELTPAMWFSMNVCDPSSYPLLPCTPESDANAPRCANQAECNGYPGGGSAFMELQFYPPGFGPWVDAPSFDNTHWGAALTVDSLEATQGFRSINENCVEPVNFSFIQRNGVPPGPPSPQLVDLASNIPNGQTLLMNPGDRIRVHIFDAPVPGGGKALETEVRDLTTGESGFMQASAANGFMNTSITDCSGTPFNFQAEYSTAKPNNISPWGAGTESISAAFETGHFVPCTSLSGPARLKLAPGVSDKYFNNCAGPYEEAAPGGDGEGALEPSDAECYPQGDTHGGLASAFPDTITGCLDTLLQNGDLDFDGTAYWPEWPTSTTPTANPSTFQFQPPTSGAAHQPYAAYQFQTDAAFSELSTCAPNRPQGCTVPPPNAPGKFYPYWTLATSPANACIFEFGNVQSGNTFGGTAQYGKLNPNNFPDLSGHFYTNNCPS
jgi:hypothetical protein